MITKLFKGSRRRTGEEQQHIGGGLGRRAFLASRDETYDDMADMLEQDTSVRMMITKYKRRARERHDLRASVYAAWEKNHAQNGVFSKAITGTVPVLPDGMVIAAFELAGELPSGLRTAATAVRMVTRLRSAFIGAFAMPALVMVILIGMLLAFSFVAIPMLARVFSPTKWPFMGKILYAVSQVIASPAGVVVFALIIGINVIAAISMPRWRGRWRLVAEKYSPVHRLYADYYGAIFLVVLATLMAAKKSFPEALRVIKRQVSPWLAWHISRMEKQLQADPDTPIKAIRTGLLNRNLADRVADAGERAEFPKAVQKYGLGAAEKLEKSVTKSAKVLNIVATLLAGGALLFIMVAFLLTAASTSEGLQSGVLGK